LQRRQPKLRVQWRMQLLQWRCDDAADRNE
jgi:hypothetical protein